MNKKKISSNQLIQKGLKNIIKISCKIIIIMKKIITMKMRNRKNKLKFMNKKIKAMIGLKPTIFLDLYKMKKHHLMI